MKKFIVLILATAALSGCGLQNQINDLKSRADSDETAIAQLQAEMAAAQSQLITLNNALSAQGADVANQLAAITTSINALNANDANYATELASIQTSLATTQNNVSVLQGQVASIQGADLTFTTNIANLQSSLNGLTATVNSAISAGTGAYNQIESQIGSLQSATTSVTSSTAALQSSVSALQSQMNAALVNIATLQGYTNIVSIKDPCGAQGSYNEVFLKLSTGQYLASFSDDAAGDNTRFSLLTDGNFVTTDGTHCYFTVSGSGTVISNEHN